jgi:hypothetical protein
MSTESFIEVIRGRAEQRVLFPPHAIGQMSRVDRMISPADVREVLFRGEIIEDYPADPRGHSCLLLGRAQDGRPVHVVCAPKDEYLAVITAYVPESTQWDTDFKRRLET